MIDLTEILAKKLALLDRQIADEKFTRDHAATPTESASDKTRQNAEQMLDSLADARKKLRLLEISIKNLPPFNNLATLNALVTLRTPLGLKEFLLVPEGLGGQSVDNVFLLSVASPLAKLFLGHKIGHTFSFNGGACQIVFLHANS